MPRRGENIRKRQDGRWEGRYIETYDINGKAKYKSVYGKSYTEVKKKVNAQRSNTISKIINTVSNLNIAQVSQEWLDSISSNIKTSSYSRYNYIINKYILSCFKDVKVSSINSEILDRYINNLFSDKSDNSNGLAPKTVKDIVSVLKRIIQYAENKGYAQKINYNMPKIKSQSNQISALTVFEQNSFVDYLRNNLEIETLGILIALYTGIRLGELCALKWHDIDFNMGFIKISKTLQRINNPDFEGSTKTIVIIDKPKSEKSFRNIPIPSFLLNILIEFKNAYSDESYILSGTTKNVDPRTYQNIFKRHLKNANIQQINFHALRHTFATRAIETGFDVKTLSEILGHSSVKFTLERYTHSSYELKKANMEKLVSCY